MFSVIPIPEATVGITTEEVAGTLSPDMGTLSMAPLPCLALNRVS